MTQPNPLAVPDAWNDVAEGYAADILPVFSLYAADALALAELPPRARVLDVASGPGTLTLLAARVADQVVAIDFAESMVDVLKHTAAREGLTNVEASVGDGQSLPFPDETFDGAFSMFGLMFFPDRAAGFSELRRVLKPGRRAVVSGWAPAERVPVLSTLFSVIRDLLPGLPFGSGKAPLSNPEEFHTEMEAAGFHDVKIHTVQHRRDAPSVQAFWTVQARSSAPIALLRRKLEPEEWKELEREITARLDEQFGSGPLEMQWEAHLGVGVR